MVAILEGDALAPMKVAREHQVVAQSSGRFPDAGVVSAQHTIVAFRGIRGVGPADRDHAAVAAMGACRACMNPASAASPYGIPDAIHADPTIMVATHGEHRCGL